MNDANGTIYSNSCHTAEEINAYIRNHDMDEIPEKIKVYFALLEKWADF